MHLGDDLRVIRRGFRQAPAPAILIVLTLGLAIGANSATFSLIDRVAPRPLPVEKPHEIVVVNLMGLPYGPPIFSGSSGRIRAMAYPLFQSLRTGLQRSLRAMGAVRMIRPLTVSAEPSAIEIYGEAVTADYFKGDSDRARPAGPRMGGVLS